MLAAGRRRQRRDRAGLDIKQRKAIVAKRQLIERRGETIGDKRNRAAVGRPRGLEVGKGIGGQPAQPVIFEIVLIQIAGAAAERREHEPAAVRRPRRRENLIEIGKHAFAPQRSAGHVEDREHGASALQRGQREPPAVRVPRAGRFDELKAVEMRIGCGADQLSPHRAGCGVGEEDIDRVAVALRQEHQL